MSDRYFSGLKVSSAALALVIITAGLLFGACSSNKEKKAEKTANTEQSAVATPAPSSTEAPEGQTGASDKESYGGLPPEIVEPCSGKNEGDACTVTITDGSQINGTCAMTRKNILGCKPTPGAGHQNPVSTVRPPDLNKNPEKLKEMGQ